jgi:hypothetical protein
MRKFISALLVMLVIASFAYAGITTINKDSTHPKYTSVSLVSQKGGTPASQIGNDKDNIMYTIAVPCTAKTDSFITWSIDISEYQSISAHYWFDTGDSSTDSTVSLNIGYKQSPILNSKFVTPSGHSALESKFADSTGTAHAKQVTPTGMQYLRFYFYPDTTTNGDDHNVAEDGGLYFRVTLLKSPIAQLNAGGVGMFSSLVIPSPSTGILGPKYFNFYLSPNGDTLYGKWEGGGPNRRTVWVNPLWCKDSFRAQGLALFDGFSTRWSLAVNSSDYDTTRVNGGDSLLIWRSSHKIVPASGVLDTVKYIVDKWPGTRAHPSGMLLELLTPQAGVTIVFDDGTGNVACGSDRTLNSMSDYIMFRERADNWKMVTYQDN